jgi:hypothetical protein
MASSTSIRNLKNRRLFIDPCSQATNEATSKKTTIKKLSAREKIPETATSRIDIFAHHRRSAMQRFHASGRTSVLQVFTHQGVRGSARGKELALSVPVELNPHDLTASTTSHPALLHFYGIFLLTCHNIHSSV